MGTLRLVGKTLMEMPWRLFSKVSPFALIRSSQISKKSAVLSGTRLYNCQVGDYTYIGRGCLIQSTDIGRFCSIADDCAIGAPPHPVVWVSTSPVFHHGQNRLRVNFAQHRFSSGVKTAIGHDVWIGIKSCIKAGVSVGHGAVIGMGSVVTRNVEPYAIVAGNPARLIRYRFEQDTIARLLGLAWWNWDERKLCRSADVIQNPTAFLDRFTGEQDL